MKILNVYEIKKFTPVQSNNEPIQARTLIFFLRTITYNLRFFSSKFEKLDFVK